jgi:hypothetical protein
MNNAKNQVFTYAPFQNLIDAARRALDSGSVEELREAVAGVDRAIQERDECAAYIALAREQTNDDLEIDDDPMVSDARPSGVWVSAWIWIDEEDVA